MAISREHRARDLSGQAHDRLFGNLWPLGQAGNERVAEIMPAVAYSGSGAGIFPGFLPFSNRFVETKPMHMGLAFVTDQAHRMARKYECVWIGLRKSSQPE